MPFKINDQLDTSYWFREYASDMRCRVLDFLTPESARSMSKDISENAQFKQAHISGNQYQEISKNAFSQLTLSRRQTLIKEVYAQAARGVGFWYGRNGLDKETTTPLNEIFQWLNSEATLDTIKQITGISSLNSASAQITSFSPGDFLTRHRDDVTSEGRKIAFVLNLSDQWHPDWGGLLQFFQDTGEPRDSWSPRYNSLCLFDVKHVHSVTCITPFAPKIRLAISGWFHKKTQP